MAQPLVNTLEIWRNRSRGIAVATSHGAPQTGQTRGDHFTLEEGEVVWPSGTERGNETPGWGAGGGGRVVEESLQCIGVELCVAAWPVLDTLCVVR